jgi:cell wall assembly regulator SMI1
MSVRWIPRIWKSPRPATPHEVQVLEKEWGVRLPEDYKRIAMTHQGMAPEPCVLDMGGGNTVVSELLTISEDEEFRAYSMSDTHALLEPYLPERVYPFASTATGDFICFDYRHDPEAPGVVFYFAEAMGVEAIHPVAGSFSEFLSRLHDG